MDAERLEEIEQLFYAAREIQSALREDFLARECGADDELRREVESLLSFERSPTGFLDRQPETLASEMFAGEFQQNDQQPAGAELGHYKIVKLLGKGGMGAVYLAEDSKLERKVAQPENE